MLQNYGGSAHSSPVYLCMHPVGQNNFDQMRVQQCDTKKSEHRWYWNNNGGNNNRQALMNLWTGLNLAVSGSISGGSQANQLVPSGYLYANQRWSYFTG